MDNRLREIQSAIELFLTEQQRFQGDMNLALPPATYWDALDVCLEVWAAGAIPAELRGGTELAISKLRLAYSEFNKTEDAHPKMMYWEAVQELEASLVGVDEGVDEYIIESMQELYKDGKEGGCTYEQIAIIYDLYDSHGSPRVDLVMKELRNPGSVIGPEWRHPEQLRREQARQRASQKLEQMQGYYQQEKEAAEKANAPCPETPFELWSLGRDGGTPISIEQAADMLKIPEEAVVELFDQFDLEAKKAKGEYLGPVVPSGDYGDGLDDMKLKELQAEAKECGIGISGKNREMLISQIRHVRVSLTG